MLLEQSLAAKVVAKCLDAGFPSQSAISQCTAFLRSQGFSFEYSLTIAEDAVLLLYNTL